MTGLERRHGRVLEGYLDTHPGSAERPRDAVVVRTGTDFAIIRTWRLRDVDCCLFEGSDVDVTPHPSVPRGDAVVEKPGIALGFVAAGAMRITQDRRTVELGSGQLALYDGVTPFALHSDTPHRYLVAHVREQALRVRWEERQRLVARDLSAFAGAAALGAMLATVVDAEEAPSPAAGQHLGDAILACLAAIVAEVRGSAVAERSTVLFGVLTEWLDGHLADRRLSTEVLAGEHFLSPRYVRKLFADHETTVTGYVRSKRLERIRDELLQPGSIDVPVSIIGTRWGFKDPSVFSRAFTKEFGQAPHAFRKTAVRRDQVHTAHR